MRVNWRKGFNRIFALGAIGWAAYVLWVGPAEREHRAAQQYVDEIMACGQVPVGSFRQCIEVANRLFVDPRHSSAVTEALRDRHVAAAFADATLTGAAVAAKGPTPSRSFDWLGALIVLGVILLPPTLAYGFVEALWRTTRCVLRGFRQPIG
jgi:hypothetical protein